MIKLHNITKKFGDITIFEGYNLEIEKGDMVAIVGKSGKGKTTLLNIIGLLDDKYEGQVSIDNEFVEKSKRSRVKFYREKLGYLFQNFALVDNKTVDYNLNIALEYSGIKNKEERAALKAEALKKVGLNGKEKTQIYKLSGGEQQRVALARILLKKSEIILADEPTGSLDEANKNEILKLLKELNDNGKIVIIVTHDNDVKNFCKKVVNL